MTGPAADSEGDATAPGLLEGVADTEAILRRALAELDLHEQHGDFLEPRFEQVLTSLMEKGHELLQLEQTDPIRRLCRDFLDIDQQNPARATDRFLKGIASITNQTKKRAGVHMMRSMEWILRRCNIRCESGYSLTKQNDLLCPSLDAYQRFPENSVRIVFKRTLRERGRLVAGDKPRNLGHVWLLTLDDKVTPAMVDQLTGENRALYVTQGCYGRLTARAPTRVRAMRTLLGDLRSIVGTNPQGQLSLVG